MPGAQGTEPQTWNWVPDAPARGSVHPARGVLGLLGTRRHACSLSAASKSSVCLGRGPHCWLPLMRCRWASSLPPRKTGRPQISPHRNGTAGKASLDIPERKIKIPLRYISTPRQPWPHPRGSVLSAVGSSEGPWRRGRLLTPIPATAPGCSTLTWLSQILN